MHILDWLVLCGTLLFIVLYGVWKTRAVNSVEGYLLGTRELRWWTIGLSIMATQASAITFLSTPGQAYADGMRFAQFYMGLPIAMVILSISFIPIFYKLKVYTAYEFLEGRFDLKTRTLTSILFLVQRGLAAGITIYAPAIILATILNWPLLPTILMIGILVIFYTFSGGTNAVSQTQKQQMIVILGGMVAAAIILMNQLPKDIGFNEAVSVAGKMGKLNVIDTNFSWDNKYNIWSGLLGGTFLFMSYFGTDQSQVQRYLSGRSLSESRLGLLFNGIVKVPMQFLVLFVGILVFVFFQFEQPPIHFNSENLSNVANSEYGDSLYRIQQADTVVFLEKETAIRSLVDAIDVGDEGTIDMARDRVQSLRAEQDTLRVRTAELIKANDEGADLDDDDYVFITFVINYLPIGLVGLLVAVIFSAAMSSTASELNALATTTVVDLYRRYHKDDKGESHYLTASRAFTVMWGAIALCFAAVANRFENLIELVNIIGSLFYGSILGIFIVAFYFKWVRGNAIFIGALIAEAFVLLIFFLSQNGVLNIAYLWLNAIGCLLAIFFAMIIQATVGGSSTPLETQEPTAP